MSQGSAGPGGTGVPFCITPLRSEPVPRTEGTYGPGYVSTPSTRLTLSVRIGGRGGVLVRKAIYATCGILSGTLAAAAWIWVSDAAFDTKILDPDVTDGLTAALSRIVLAVLTTVIAWALLRRAFAKGSASQAASRSRERIPHEREAGKMRETIVQGGRPASRGERLAGTSLSVLLCVAALAGTFVLGRNHLSESTWTRGPAGPESEAARSLVEEGVPPSVLETAQVCGKHTRRSAFDISGYPTYGLECAIYPVASETASEFRIELSREASLYGNWGGSDPLVSLEGIPGIQAITSDEGVLGDYDAESPREGFTSWVDVKIPTISRSLEGQVLKGYAEAQLTLPVPVGSSEYIVRTYERSREIAILVLAPDQLDRFRDAAGQWGWVENRFLIIGLVALGLALAVGFAGASWENATGVSRGPGGKLNRVRVLGVNTAAGLFMVGLVMAFVGVAIHFVG